MNYVRSHAASVIALILIGSLIACKKEKTKEPVRKIPVIATFSPETAPFNSEVVINGASFGSNPRVRFNGTEAVVSSSTDRKIVTSVPVGATIGKISVIAGTDTAYSFTDFTVGTP